MRTHISLSINGKNNKNPSKKLYKTNKFAAEILRENMTLYDILDAVGIIFDK